MRSWGIALVLAACSFEHGKLRVGDDLNDGGTDAIVDAPRDADTRCQAFYPLMNGTSRYRIGTGTWYEGEMACEQEGAHLVVIDNANENSFVLSLAPDGNIFIGMSDHRVEGTFQWVTGRFVPGDDTNWQDAPTQQPNNAGGEEDCGEMNIGAVWNDLGCHYPQTYVCECDAIALPQTPTWCQTGSISSCNTCGDACNIGELCYGDQVCR